MIQTRWDDNQRLMRHNEGSMSREPIRSRFAADPEMREIVAMFVGEMPARVAEVLSAWTGGELERLRIIAHQLKGAAGGYGFPEVGARAGELEAAIRSGRDSPSELEPMVREFVKILQQVSESD